MTNRGTAHGTDRVVVGNLRVDRGLYDFITDEAIPGTGIDPDSFWAGGGGLARRRRMQARTIGWGCSSSASMTPSQ